jgi:uncharacterized cupredoxin-like copper-binding protein
MKIGTGFALLAVVAGLAGACSGGGGEDSAEASEEADAPRGTAYGHGAAAGQATRTIEVTMTDDLKFDPEAIEVTPDEIVTFKLTNAGKIVHEFTIGGQVAQDLHESEMAAASMKSMSGAQHKQHIKALNAKAAKLDQKADAFDSVHVAPGETQEVTWAFSGEKPPSLGCHQPGHYKGGMKGEVIFNS